MQAAGYKMLYCISSCMVAYIAEAGRLHDDKKGKR